ncbi:MAG: response regulator [Opitutales bacterium]|nr:response regulator [Opitutales bacterium]
MPVLMAQVDQTDLRSLVDCSFCIEKERTLEEAHRLFQKHGHEFMAVLDGDRLLGMCSRSRIGMVLGSRFGFSIFSKKPIGEHLLPSPVIIRIGTPLRSVLDTVFSRTSDEFYDDIALTDSKGFFAGLIQVHSLVKLQHRMLLEKLKQVEMQERNLRSANQQLEKLAAEINAANADIAKARDMALEGTRMKSEFLANMSHEIRTPMNGVIGMVNLLMETTLSPEQIMFAKTLRSSGEALLDIINDILDFSKIEAGKMEVSNHEFDIREVLESSVHLLVERAAAKNIELIWDISREVPLKAIGDSTRIRQILVNLVGNAVKFTSIGEVVVAARYNNADNTLRVEVQDSGPGISEAVMAKLFAPFTQADGSTTRKHGGTGLGLSISKRLAELMSGRIGCESKLGKGSTFWFEVPLTAMEDAGRIRSYDFVDARMLVVDSNESLRKVFSYHLEDANIRCTCAGGTEEARLALYKAHSDDKPFCIMMVDLSSASDEVAAFCSSLRNDRRFDALRIVGMTTVGHASHALLSDRNVICRHIYKPIRFADLYACLDTITKSASSAEPFTSSNADCKCASVMRPLQILIVEDTVTNQVVARMMVEKLGHKCVVATNGLEALEALRRQHFDCVLMDCMMPEMDGFETTRRIRSGFCGDAAQDIHIIAMTANAMRGDRERCIESGMDEYISKPIRRPELIARLENAQRLLYV